MIIKEEIQRKREAIASLYPKGREVLIIDGASNSYYIPDIPLIAMSMEYTNSPTDYITVLHHEFAHHYYRRYMTEIFPLIKRYKGYSRLQLILNILEDAFIERNHPYLPRQKFVEHAHKITKKMNPAPIEFPYSILIWHYDLKDFYTNIPEKEIKTIYEESENIYRKYEELRMAFEHSSINAEPILEFLLQFLTDEERERLPEGEDTDNIEDVPPPPPFDYDDNFSPSNPNPYFGRVNSRNYITTEEYYSMTKEQKKIILQRGFGIKGQGESNISVEIANSSDNLLTNERMSRRYGYGLRIDQKRILKWKRKTKISAPTQQDSPLYRNTLTKNPESKIVLIIDTSYSMSPWINSINSLLHHIPADIIMDFNDELFVYVAPKGKRLKASMHNADGGTVFPDISLPDADKYTFIIITDGDVANPNDILQFRGEHKTIFIVPESELDSKKRQILIPYITLENAIKNPSKLKELLS